MDSIFWLTDKFRHTLTVDADVAFEEHTSDRECKSRADGFGYDFFFSLINIKGKALSKMKVTPIHSTKKLAIEKTLIGVLAKKNPPWNFLKKWNTGTIPAATTHR